MVRGLDTLQRKRREEDLARLSRMAAERRATAFVSGLPLNMDGTEGPQAELVREFCCRLERASGLTVHFQDERLTSVEAEGRMKDAGWSLKKLLVEKRKGAVDRLAAVLVLEDYVGAQASREGAK
jgi:putative Holliday junction resolvase